MPFAFSPRAEEKGIVFWRFGFLRLKTQPSSAPLQAWQTTPITARPAPAGGCHPSR
jgi:hypothetical protein